VFFFMYFMRIVRALLGQSWSFPASAGLALVLIGVGIVAALAHWPSTSRFFFWGVVWGIVAAGAWAVNRSDASA